MRIGLTYDLRSEYLAAGYGVEETAEFDREDTIAGLEEALAAAGHAPERIGNARQLVARLLAGDRWDLVFNIAEGLHGLGREALVPALLDAHQIPYTFSDPLVLALALHKGMTKRVIRDAGLPTPAFAVVEQAGDAEAVALPLPLFVKPVAEGTGKGVSAASIIRRREDLAPACADLLARFRQPVLVEELLTGREFTVGLVGTGPRARALGTLEVLLGPEAEEGAYSYENKAHFEGKVTYRVGNRDDDPQVREAEEVALGAWRALGCRDGGRLDLRCDAQGRCQFLEVNPLAGLNPTISDLPILCRQVGITYHRLIAEIVESAMERVGD
jgi:D-alanine-D-alanine ligase